MKLCSLVCDNCGHEYQPSDPIEIIDNKTILICNLHLSVERHDTNMLYTFTEHRDICPECAKKIIHLLNV